MSLLTLIEKVEKRGTHWYGNYQCGCGNTKVVRMAHVRSGGTTSCGCVQQEARIRHGKAYSLEYKKWMWMKSRCKPTYAYAENYYDRGIRVCERWINSFENFYADMGDCNGLDLDRRHNDKGYSPDNCRWVTRSVNLRNRRKVQHSSIYRGVRKHQNKWVAEIGLGERKTTYIGIFNTPEEAALAWNEVAKNHEGFILNKVD